MTDTDKEAPKDPPYIEAILAASGGVELCQAALIAAGREDQLPLIPFAQDFIIEVAPEWIRHDFSLCCAHWLLRSQLIESVEKGMGGAKLIEIQNQIFALIDRGQA